MTPLPVTVAAATVASPIASTPPITLQSSSAYDVERLRNLIEGAQPSAPAPPVAQVGTDEFVTLGDSILQGMAKFNVGYNESLESIHKKLQDISDPTTLGNDFGQIMELQVEVARWSMSVMGVDNASKAGTNTIKELSKGG